MTDPRHELGLSGEDAVAGWLCGRGWKVLARRWRSAVGELDLVCLDPDGILVGVEVKVRRTGRAGSGAESVDSARVRHLRAGLAAYAATAPGRRSLRVDLITLDPAGDGAWRLKRLPAIDAW